MVGGEATERSPDMAGTSVQLAIRLKSSAVAKR
jgi:hypothetical protein